VLKRLAPVLIIAVALSLAGCSPAAPKPEPGDPVPAGHPGKAACKLVSQAEVSKISGVHFGPGFAIGPVAVTTKSAPAVVSTESCSYKNSKDVYVGYYLDTINQPAPSYEAKVWADDKHEEPNSDYVALGGQPAFRMTEAGQGGQNYVQFIFYRGQIVVQVETSGVPNGTAEKVAALVAKRM
jgi:hypothetical protein